MRSNIVGQSLLVVALLVGCGDKVVLQGEDGSKVVHAAGASAAAKVNLPSHMPLYPGAMVESSTTGISSGQEGPRRAGMVVLSSRDAPDKVADFYRSRLASSTLTERSENNINGMVMLTAASADDADHGVQVNIAPRDGGSIITLIYNSGEG